MHSDTRRSRLTQPPLVLLTLHLSRWARFLNAIEEFGDDSSTALFIQVREKLAESDLIWTEEANLNWFLETDHFNFWCDTGDKTLQGSDQGAYHWVEKSMRCWELRAVRQLFSIAGWEDKSNDRGPIYLARFHNYMAQSKLGMSKAILGVVESISTTKTFNESYAISISLILLLLVRTIYSTRCFFFSGFPVLFAVVVLVDTIVCFNSSSIADSSTSWNPKNVTL